MKLLRYIAALLILVHFSPTVVFAGEKHDDQADAGRVERLVQLCKLWNQIKYFHPYLAYRNDIDWDAALLKAIPKVNGSSNDAEFGAALQSMLDALGDPATRIIKKNAPSGFESTSDERHPTFKFTEDKILIVSINRYSDLDDYAGTIERMREISKQATTAKSVIFDLRSPISMNSDRKESLQYAIQISRLAGKLSTAPLLTPGQRVRMHIGFKPQFGVQVTGFNSNFSVQDGQLIMPHPQAKDLPVIFLVNRNSYIPIEALALQEAGKCIIAAEEGIDDSSIINAMNYELNNDLEVQIRISELVYRNGTTGIQPNLQIKGDNNKAFETALSLARNFNPTAVVRKEIPTLTAPPSDKRYSEMTYPPMEYRLLAAFRIWGVINYFSPYKYLFDKDWSSVLKEFIPKFTGAGNPLEYNLAIAEMLTQIHDVHTLILSPVLFDYFGDSLSPINVRFVEGLPVIASIYDVEEAENLNLEIGDIILKIDGEDVQDRIARLKKYLSASTPDSLMRRVGEYILLGPDGSTFTLTVRGRSNQVREVKVTRMSKFLQYNRQRKGEIYRLLPGNIGYVDLDRLTFEMVDEMFDKLKGAEAIIFDMRSRPLFTGFYIVQRLTEETRIPIAIFRRPVVTALNNTSDLYNSNVTYSYLDYLPITDSRKYKGKTVMLIDDRAQSQAETTGLVFRSANGTKFIGSATAGTDGEVTNFYVPGGILIYFTGQELKHPDGRQLQRIGIQPDIEVKPTLKGMREGRDEALEKAVEYLKKELSAAKKKE